MELITVRKVAMIVNKTPSMIYYLANIKGIFTKYPTGLPPSPGAPIYMLNKNEVVSYFENKEPRKDYNTFLGTTSVFVEEEEYVSIRRASILLDLSEGRIRYLTRKYSIKTTKVLSPRGRKSKVVHSLICLKEMKEISEIEFKIMELKSSLPERLR
jgi:hypothetical protein